VVDKS